MSYRKLKATALFDGFSMRTGSDVLICAEDGTVDTIITESEAGSDIESYEGILCPGFINCHCHLELSHLRNEIAENLGLISFVLAVIRQRNQPDEVKKEAIHRAETEMGEDGIVAVGDICNTGDTVDIKSLKHLHYYNFIELLGWSPDQADARFENGVRVAALFQDAGIDDARIALCPHAPYSVSDALWNRMAGGFSGKTITIHNQESAAENEYFLHGTGDLNWLYAALHMDTSQFRIPGTHSLPYFLPKLKNASKILLVHNTYMDERDESAALNFSRNLYLCLCPNANLYIENRLPPIPAFLKSDARLVLGTDSLASNRQLSIMEEMKTIKKYFPFIPSSQLLLWATSNGARALSLDEKLGDFTKGKKPGIVLIDRVRQGEIQAESKSRRLL